MINKAYINVTSVCSPCSRNLDHLFTDENKIKAVEKVARLWPKLGRNSGKVCIWINGGYITFNWELKKEL